GRGSGIDGGVGNRMGMRRRPSPVPQRRRQCSEVRRYALGVDTRMFSYRPPAQGRGSRPFTFLTVGSLVPVKNHKGMLLALAEVRRRAPNADVRLQIAGAGPLRRPLEQVASRLELEGYVDFLGEVRHEQLPDVVGLADCFLLGSYHEAQCMALLEAMACGRPWVAPPVGSAVDCADFGQGGDPSGVLARGQGGGDLADAMLRVLDLDSPALEAMGLAARSLIETHYELGTQAARLADLLAALTQDEPIVTIQSASA
ncbi:MAG: glycosyltransferase family 4 protein, partial [Chloroflexia bacterium]